MTDDPGQAVDAAGQPMTQPEAPPALPDGHDATLVLCRHGESTWIVEGRFQGAADPPLSARGEAQAERLAARLADRDRLPALPIPPGPPIAAWHSPLRRTTATAAAIETALGIVSTADPDLREIGQGDWEGRPVAEILATEGDRLRTWRRTPVGHEAPNGETLAEVAVRARRALARILGALEAASAAGGPADPDRAPVIGYGADTADEPWGLVVGHDGILRVVMLQLLGLPLERFWAFPFVPAGITVIRFHAGHVIVRAHDLEAHLGSLEKPGQAPGESPREGAL